ncbi:MAG: dienelactone hydrolase family protein [Myxococcota bacterium]
MNTDGQVSIRAGKITLEGNLTVPQGARALVLFAHGSGSSRHSPRNRRVAAQLNERGLATLLFDLLTREEEEVDLRTAEYRFDIDLLAQRLGQATDWLGGVPALAALAPCYFGSSTGAAAALIAAAQRPERIAAVVSRGGRPDLAGPALSQVRAPTLLIVGGADEAVLELNRRALTHLHAEAKLEVVPQATHLFEEPGALDQVANLAAEWFVQHSAAAEETPSPPGRGMG